MCVYFCVCGSTIQYFPSKNKKAAFSNPSEQIHLTAHVSINTPGTMKHIVLFAVDERQKHKQRTKEAAANKDNKVGNTCYSLSTVSRSQLQPSTKRLLVIVPRGLCFVGFKSGVNTVSKTLHFQNKSTADEREHVLGPDERLAEIMGRDWTQRSKQAEGVGWLFIVLPPQPPWPLCCVIKDGGRRLKLFLTPPVVKAPHLIPLPLFH